MSYLLPILLALHLNLAATAFPVSSFFPSCSPVLPRIVGGTLAPSQMARFMASLVDPFNSKCSAALLSARWALTAAHCSVTPTGWTLFAGDLVAGTGEPIAVCAVHSAPVDPSTIARFPSDIALVELCSDAPANASFVRVNVDPRVPTDGAYARAVGYGDVEEGGDGFASGDRLRWVDIPVVGNAQCGRNYAGVAEITEDKLCAGQEGCDACQGDSGGPLLQYDEEGAAIVVGVVSSGVGCARRNYPGIYARVSEVVEWMETRDGVVFERGEGALQVFAEEPGSGGEGIGVGAEDIGVGAEGVGGGDAGSGGAGVGGGGGGGEGDGEGASDGGEGVAGGVGGVGGVGVASDMVSGRSGGVGLWSAVGVAVGMVAILGFIAAAMQWGKRQVRGEQSVYIQPL